MSHRYSRRGSARNPGSRQSRGRLGRSPFPDPDRVAYLTQTTLSLDETKDIIAALKQKFPNIKRSRRAGYFAMPPKIRQVAVKQVASESDLLTSRRLGKQLKTQTVWSRSARILAPTLTSSTATAIIESQWLIDVKTIALTAGASAPECLVRRNHDLSRYQGFRQRAGTRSHAGKTSASVCRRRLSKPSPPLRPRLPRITEPHN